MLHRKNGYDLILLDLQMPGMDGFQLMAGLKTNQSDSYLPVIVLTAQPAHSLRALQTGAKDFISKPFDLVEVKTRIHNMLEVRLQEARELQQGTGTEDVARLYDGSSKSGPIRRPADACNCPGQAPHFVNRRPRLTIPFEVYLLDSYGHWGVGHGQDSTPVWPKGWSTSDACLHIEGMQDRFLDAGVNPRYRIQSSEADNHVGVDPAAYLDGWNGQSIGKGAVGVRNKCRHSARDANDIAEPVNSVERPAPRGR